MYYSRSTITVLWVAWCIANVGSAQTRSQSSITDNVACDTCHTPAGWKMPGAAAGKSGFDHAVTGFPLTGQHNTVSCTGCHKPNQRISRECVSCHQDDHQGRLGRFCDSCHSSMAWNQTKAIDMHRRTRLPLTGMHVLADCTQCHQRTGERQWTGVPSDCFACHENDYRSSGTHPVHSGTATQQAFPRDCALCHRSFGWSPATIDPTTLGSSTALSTVQNHDTRFVISYGPHRTAPCESCHVSENVSRAVSCTGCHEHNPVRLIQLHRGKQHPSQGAACLGCHPGGSAR